MKFEDIITFFVCLFVLYLCSQALLIIQKIVFYLTQMEIRFVYQWNELFNSLFLMINYISTKISEYKNEILIKNIINMVFNNILQLIN